MKLPLLLLLLCLGQAHAAGQAPLAAAAVADATRPDADRARDADRKPAEMLAFARVQPGQTVVDYFAGRGYFTRLFSTAVGPQGAVYAVTPQLLLDRLQGKPLPPPVSAEPGRAHVHDTVGAASPGPTWCGRRRTTKTSASGAAPPPRPS